MKGIILLNGEPYRGEIDARDALVYCADGAYDWAKGKVKIDENLGDFDSARAMPVPPPKEIFPEQKNETDGEIALERMLSVAREKAISEIEIYGGGGGREDHFLGNLHLLYRACMEGMPCSLVTNTSVLSAHRGKFTLKGIKGKTVSLLPFGGDTHIINNKGLFYPTDDLTLFYGCCRGISNVGTDENAEINCDRGVLLAAVNKEKDVKNHLFETSEGNPTHSAPL